MNPVDPSRLAYSYVRFSTPSQASGDSLNRQTRAAADYAEKNGLQLDVSLRDLGVSAFRGANKETGAFGRFLAMVQTGQVPRGATLIVESLDRISRQDVLTAMHQMIGLLKAGLVVVTLMDNQIYTEKTVQSDVSKLMLSLLVMSRAHEESVVKSDRVAAAWQTKRSRAAAGEGQTSRCVAWCSLEGSPRGGGRYVLIPDRAALVVRIFEMTAAGYGHRAIAKRLNEDKVSAWGRGDGWQPSYVSKIVVNRAVLGFYQPHRKQKGDVRRTPDGPELALYYPPVITEELYYRAAAARRERRHKSGIKGNGVANLFSNLGKCASCGRSMVHLNKGDTSKGGRWLVCDSTVRGITCEQPARWRYSRAETVVLDGVRRLDVAAVLGQADPSMAARGRLTILAGQLVAEERKRDRLLEMLGDLEDLAIVAVVRSSAEAVIRLRAEHAQAETEAGVAMHAGGSLADRVALVGQLSDRLGSAEGQELVDLRMMLSQELRRVLVRLRFTPWTILADYKTTGHPRGFLSWNIGVPLLRSVEDDEQSAEDAEIDALLDGAPRFGRRRLPPSSS